ncbi:MAG: cytochrome c peroxidase [Saprospiraceae bacterium]
MKKLQYTTIAFLVLAVFASCTREEEDLNSELEAVLELADPVNGKSGFLMPKSFDFNSIPQDPNNPITAAKVQLGKFLYHETGIAQNPMQEEGRGTYSCATCHFASAGFQAGRFQGIGDGGSGMANNGLDRNRFQSYSGDILDVQPIRTPTAMNAAYQELMLWNGQFGATGMNEGTEYAWTAGTPKENNHLGFQGLETQAIAGLGVHRLVINETLINELGYQSMFDAAFPHIPALERYTPVTAGLAIAAYERTLLSNQAPFQQFLEGKYNAMSNPEKRGAILFFGKAQCASCHTGPALSSMSFHAIGMGDLDLCPEETFKTNATVVENQGRGGFTGREEDKFAFKTPSLYNLKDSPFYGHGASLRTLRDVVVYKNRAVKENPRVSDVYLSPLFAPLGLSASEIDDLTAFLTWSLHDPNLKRYEPDYLLSGQCFPSNDPQSSEDLGCN